MLKFDLRHAGLVLALLAGAAQLQAQELARAPQAPKTVAIVAAANPLAADAGIEILRRQRRGRRRRDTGDARTG